MRKGLDWVTAGRQTGKSYLRHIYKLYFMQKEMGLLSVEKPCNMKEYSETIIDSLTEIVEESAASYQSEELKFIFDFIEKYTNKDELVSAILADKYKSDFIQAERMIFKDRIGKIHNDKSNSSM